MNSIATAILNGRTDTSFVDDLNALRGTVNSRVALLLRSIEVHPLQLRCVVLSEHTPPHFHSPGAPTHAGVFTFAKKSEKKHTPPCRAQTVSNSCATPRAPGRQGTAGGVALHALDPLARCRGTVAGRPRDASAHAGVFEMAPRKPVRFATSLWIRHVFVDR